MKNATTFNFSIFVAGCYIQAICEHSVKRLLEDPDVKQQIENLKKKHGSAFKTLKLYFKYGCDGSSKHLVANQATETEEALSGNMISSNLVVLQLVADINDENVILFTNKLHNSEIACRPARHWYVRENSETLDIETKRLITACEKLKPIEVNGLTIEFQGFNSMNDQKAVNAIVEEACTKRCPCCHLLPREHMEIFQDFPPPDITFLKSMCLSSLHFGLNLFEHLINKVGGNQDFKLDTATEKSGNALRRQTRIQIIKDAYKTEKKIRISYMLKGQGTTNTGNTVRRVFSEPAFLAQQIGVSEKLVQSLINVWTLLKCNFILDYKKFYNYCQEVKALYKTELPWCNMNPSLFKILDHAHLIIERYVVLCIIDKP